MEGLARLLPLMLPAAAQQPGQLPHLLELTQHALLAMLRQALERIARMREAAAACMQRLLPAAQAAGVPMAAQLAEAVQGRPLEQFSNLEALPPLAALVVHPPLQQTLLEGLTFSIGGLDAQLSAAAGNALADAVQEQLQVRGWGFGAAGCGTACTIPCCLLGHGQMGCLTCPAGPHIAHRLLPARPSQEDLPALEELGGNLLTLWRRQRRGGRMCTPLLLTADLLLSRTAVRDLQPPESGFPEQVGRGVAGGGL